MDFKKTKVNFEKKLKWTFQKTKVDFKKNLGLNDLKNILKIFKFDKRQIESATKLVNAMYDAMISKDASLIEINPLVVTKNGEILCLDA